MLLRKLFPAALVAAITAVALGTAMLAPTPAYGATLRVTASRARVDLARVGNTTRVTLRVRGSHGALSWTNSSSRRKVATCKRHFKVVTITGRHNGDAVCHIGVRDTAGDHGSIAIPVKVGKGGLVGGPPSLLPVRHDPFPRTVPMSGTRYRANRHNPLAGGTWAVNNGNNHLDESNITAHFNRSKSASVRRNLRRIGSHPYVTWFTSAKNKFRRVGAYVRSEQRGHARALVQIALFGIYGIAGGESNKHALTRAQRTRYRTWTRDVSRVIGKRRVAIILEPDAALLANRPSGRSAYADAPTRRSLIRWAARYFHRHNRRTAIYLDAGDADWLRVTDAVRLLQQIGVRYTRGFALGATHYSSVTANIGYAKRVSNRLAGKGIRNKKAVLDTADNGHPYTFGQWRARFGRRSFDNSRRCTSLSTRLCNSLGILPTWKTGDRALNRLRSSRQAAARRYVDGYLWFGRPWLTNQAHPFNLKKAVAAARYDKYFRHG